jgi:DNA-binding response OmpR family regulator
MQILVADDDPLQTGLLQVLLNDYGHQVVVVSNGAAAWEEVQLRPFDILITDWIMPGMSGQDLVNRIRAEEFGKRMYVILSSSRGAALEVGETMMGGADDLLEKPVSEEDLQARLATAEEKLKARQAG